MNYKRKYIAKYIFNDGTETFNRELAYLYDEQFYERLDNLSNKLNSYLKDNCIETFEGYKQYNKEDIDNFKKEYYNILFELFQYANYITYYKYFANFIDNVDNDLQGAARCINNRPYPELIYFGSIGYIILSFDNKGRKFKNFNDKCNYLDKEYYDLLLKDND